jgi:hypothetical protein
MEQVIVGHSDAHLALTPIELAGNGSYGLARVDVHLASLSASSTVEGNYADGFMDLVEFFTSLEESWSGWPGDKVYESVNHDLRLVASHKGSSISLDVILRPEMSWRLSFEIVIEPGEELSRLATDIRVAFTHEHLHRRWS